MKATIFHTFIAIVMLTAYVGSDALASGYDQQKQQLNNLYSQLMEDPSNVDLTMQYAELAVEMGDYEAAIPPMERLLMNNPEVAKIKLELGILYYLLGSYDVSKSYLNQAKASATAKPTIKQQADEYLSRM